MQRQAPDALEIRAQPSTLLMHIAEATSLMCELELNSWVAKADFSDDIFDTR